MSRGIEFNITIDAEQVIPEISHSRQLTTLVVTTKPKTRRGNTHKKLTQVKNKTPLVRIARRCLSRQNCDTQYSTED